MTYAELNNGKTIREGFAEFHANNPHVYAEFEKQALLAISKGRKKLSAKLILNWIRWNELLRTSDKNFKINDAFQSYYARLFEDQHQEHKDIFEKRTLRNEHKGEQVMKVGKNGQLEFL